MLSGRLADTAGAVPHGYVCPGVGDVLHDDIGSVALHLEVMDTGDIWVVEAGSESGLSLGWIEERERSCIGGEWSGAIPYRR